MVRSISRCAAFMPELRSEEPPPADISSSLAIPAARRFTVPRTRIARMTKKAISAVGMKTPANTSRLAAPSFVGIRSSSVSMGARF